MEDIQTTNYWVICCTSRFYCQSSSADLLLIPELPAWVLQRPFITATCVSDYNVSVILYVLAKGEGRNVDPRVTWQCHPYAQLPFRNLKSLWPKVDSPPSSTEPQIRSFSLLKTTPLQVRGHLWVKLIIQTIIRAPLHVEALILPSVLPANIIM